jgi:hypothetical protein
MQVSLFHRAASAAGDLSDASALVTSAGVYGENQVEWSRGCGRRSGSAPTDRDRRDRQNRFAKQRDGPPEFSPEGTATFGPWRSTEFYVNAGTGFHSNSARWGRPSDATAAAIPPDPVLLVRAKAPRSASAPWPCPHLQSTVSLWALRLGWSSSTTATSARPSRVRRASVRRRVRELHSPKPWLVFDGDVSWSRARFAEFTRPGPTFPRPSMSWSPAGERGQLPSHVRQPAPALFRRARSSGTTPCGPRPPLLNAEGGYQVLKALV